MYIYIHMKYPPSAIFLSPAGGAVPSVLPLGRLRRPFGKRKKREEFGKRKKNWAQRAPQYGAAGSIAFGGSRRIQNHRAIQNRISI